MRSAAMSPTLYFLILVGAAFPAWYLYQIGSRKKKRIRYKLTRTAVAMSVCLIAFAILRQHEPEPVAVGLAFFIGAGTQWLFVAPPKRDRRIPAAVRREVIDRDLTSKGLKWDPAKYHIDHIVAFSDGGDHSPRNLRVLEKHKNLRKGSKRPGVRDFLG
jgi:hypothetical protein